MCGFINISNEFVQIFKIKKKMKMHNEQKVETRLPSTFVLAISCLHTYPSYRSCCVLYYSVLSARTKNACLCVGKGRHFCPASYQDWLLNVNLVCLANPSAGRAGLPDLLHWLIRVVVSLVLSIKLV